MVVVTFSSGYGHVNIPEDDLSLLAGEEDYAFNARPQAAGPPTIGLVETARADLAVASGNPWKATMPHKVIVSGFPAVTTSGAPVNVTVTVEAAEGDTATSYTGTIAFSSSDEQASLPAPYTFAPDDKGVRTFTVILHTPGSHSITVTDKATGISGTQENIEVAATPSQDGQPAGNTVAAVSFVGYGHVALVAPIFQVMSDSPPRLPVEPTENADAKQTPPKPPTHDQVVDEYFKNFEDRGPYNPFLD
jgi:hypothetical protein